jgi:hypothetical protein
MKKLNKLLLKQIKDLEKINRKWVDRIAEDHEGLLTADGFDSAILGISDGIEPVIVYSYNQCVHVLCVRDEMTEEDAIEHMSFNVTGAYVGKKTPLFIHEVCE